MVGLNTRELQLVHRNKRAYMQDLGGEENLTTAQADLATWAGLGKQLARRAAIAGDIPAFWAAVRETRACLTALGLRRQARVVARDTGRKALTAAILEAQRTIDAEHIPVTERVTPQASETSEPRCVEDGG
jgi:hypothetical protein